MQHAVRPCPSLSISCSLLRHISIESMMSSNHLILCHLLLFLPSVFPSIRVFFNELALCIKWPKYWSFTISLSSEYSQLISSRIDWFHLEVQGTLKSLLQYHSSKTSILQGSDFIMVLFSHSYMTTRKTIALTIWTFYDLHVNHMQRNTFTATSRLVFDLQSGYHGLTKLTHKGNHHSLPLVSLAPVHISLHHIYSPNKDNYKVTFPDNTMHNYAVYNRKCTNLFPKRGYKFFEWCLLFSLIALTFFTLHFHVLEKEMATHSSVLA